MRVVFGAAAWSDLGLGTEDAVGRSATESGRGKACIHKARAEGFKQ